MNGAFGKILLVNLSDKTSREEFVPEDIYHQFLGGKGLATWLLLRHNPPGVDPLSPENAIIFATGPITDTKVFGSCRYGVFTKSPLTGIYLESYSGGDVAEPMSRTGYDAVILRGACSQPTYLEISDRMVRFHDATRLWGMETYAAEDAIRQETNIPQSGIVVIGPAGERLVRFAVIENNYWRSCGRGGAGAVLGAKKVKGLVFWGSQKKTLAYPERLTELWQETGKRAKDNPGAIAYKKYGTPMVVAMTNKIGAFPTQYWSRGTYEKWENISAEALLADCDVRPKACPKCFMACGKLSQVKEGRHRGLTLEGPEYETIDAFGGICLIGDIREILYLNDLCDRLGIDTISAGNLAGFSIEASHRKQLGFRLEYGDVDGIASLLEKIVKLEDEGAILAQGIRFAAREWDLEDLAVHVKGMDPPGYEPRVLKGMGLAYATSDRGACHLRSTFYKPELAGIIAPEQIEGKAALFTEWEDRLTLQDGLILCRFFRDLYLWEEFATMICGTLGLELNKADLRRIAGNILNLAHEYNLREGVGPSDDILPNRLLQEPLTDSGKSLPKSELQQMVSEYHSLRGWKE